MQNVVIYLCSTRCYQLQKRLPSDRVTGSISITISSDLDLPNDTSGNMYYFHCLFIN